MRELAFVEIRNIKYLERDTTVSVLVHDVEHFLHEHGIRPHPERACELAFRKRGSHHGDDLTAIAVLGSASPFARS